MLEVRPKTNEVVVGPREALAIAELAGSRISWAGLPPADLVAAGTAGRSCSPFDCEVQVRAHGDPVPATARVDAGELVVTLREPLIGVAPGQSAVIYLGTRVLGQCTIDRTVSAVAVGRGVAGFAGRGARFGESLGDQRNLLRGSVGFRGIHRSFVRLEGPGSVARVEAVPSEVVVQGDEPPQGAWVVDVGEFPDGQRGVIFGALGFGDREHVQGVDAQEREFRGCGGAARSAARRKCRDASTGAPAEL